MNSLRFGTEPVMKMQEENIHYARDYSSKSQKPDDLSMKGMMARIQSTSPQKDRASFVSKSPSRKEAKHLIFPKEPEAVVIEKKRVLPPTRTLSSIAIKEGGSEQRRPLLESSHSFESSFVNEEQYWTTVFGFPPSEVEQVLSYFRRLGELDEIRTVESFDIKDVPAGPTWIHLRWTDKLDAEKALRKQGTILRAYSSSPYADGNETLAMDYMIGVMPFSQAKKVLGGNANETIYWQSPIRKKTVDKLRTDYPSSQSYRQDSSEPIFAQPIRDSSSVQLAPSLNIIDRVLNFLF